MIKDHFIEIIGQQRVKPTLNFYIESYKKEGGFLKPIFFASPRGCGKTKIARALGRNLADDNNLSKRFIEVNGASIKRLNSFIDEIILPYISAGQYATLFIDEIHSVDQSVLDWMLTILNLPDGVTETKNFHGGIEYSFDYKKFSFICASTNPERLSLPLLSRLKKIELEPYTKPDLIQILHKTIKSISFPEGTDEKVVAVCRDNPRTLVEDIGRDLKLFCMTRNIKSFNNAQWDDFRRLFNIRELGLTSLELQVLHFLRNCGPQSLTSISAKLGIDAVTVRRNIELFLLSHDLIVIDGKRRITGKGQILLKKIEENV